MGKAPRRCLSHAFQEPTTGPAPCDGSLSAQDLANSAGMEADDLGAEKTPPRKSSTNAAPTEICMPPQRAGRASPQRGAVDDRFSRARRRRYE